MNETRVSTAKKFDRQLLKCPRQIRQKAYTWILSVENYGIRKVRKITGYHDEPLKGKRRGQRSVRLSRSYRLIYCEIDEIIHIKLLEVSKHEY